jgi:hypothetical protein
MNYQQQPAVAINIKASLVATNENRFIALPSPPSFNLLVEKIAAVFNLSIDQVPLRVHYIDESDRVTVSSDYELACALSLLPATNPSLRLFVSTAVSAATQPVAAQPIHDEPNQPTEVQLTTNSDIAQQIQPNDVDTRADAGEAAIDTLKRRLSQEGIEELEKRCVRLLAKFGGDVDKALTALERCHERKQLRLLAGNNKKCPDPTKPEALHQQREARRAERLAARLAHQEQKKHLRQASNDINDDGVVKKKKKVDTESAEVLVARLAELGLAVGKGRCKGALSRANGDVDAARADLVAWCAKRQELKGNKPNAKTTAAPIDDADTEKQLSQLGQMGFGPSIADDKHNSKTAERIKRRNERLLKRFNGDLSQVAGLLEARKAKVEARIAARKVRQGQRPRCKRVATHPTEELVAEAPTAC